LGVAVLGLMTHHAHDVGLMTLLIDGVAHGFAIQGERVIILPGGFIPALNGAVQVLGLEAGKEIADDEEAGDEIAALFPSATKTFPGVLAEALSPIRDGGVATHSTKDRSGSDAEDCGEGMSASLTAAGIGDVSKEIG